MGQRQPRLSLAAQVILPHQITQGRTAQAEFGSGVRDVGCEPGPGK